MADGVGAGAVTGPVRVLILLRVLTLYPVVLAWGQRRPSGVELALLAVLVSGTALLALRWDVIARHVRRHPAWAALDVVVSLVVLAYCGLSSPFVAYTLTSAVLVGFLVNHLAATLVCTLLGTGTLLIGTLEDPQGALPTSTLGLLAAYVLLTLTGGAFRQIHDRLADALHVAVAAEGAAATANERTRLARDLHDGVCSTLHGLVLQSTALARTAEASDPHLAALARDLEEAARSALAQSREVLTGLRRDDDSAPLLQAVADRVRRWQDATGITADFTAAGVADLAPAARIAALRVLDEALENVRRHARARHVQVRLTGDERTVQLEVLDDGTGLSDRRPGVREGHYGVLGMSERAGVAGGALSVAPGPGDADRPGTQVVLELPRTVPA
ncbi:MAG: sensor histidine kinase [Angustibacter sp.]